MKITSLVTRFGLAFGLAVVLSPFASANNFSPVIEREKRGSSVSLEKALERSSTRAKTRRPGLGAFTRRAQSRTRTTAEQTSSDRNPTRSLRTSTRRLGGGRNGYARYLRSLETSNANRVSRLRSGRVTSDQRADTESRIRNR